MYIFTSDQKFQSTLPVRGATIASRSSRFPHVISIHAPRAGSDQRIRFIQTISRRISIHAPRAGSDRVQVAMARIGGHFNPRSPCGERLAWLIDSYLPGDDFNPRSPCGERRDAVIGAKNGIPISIHAPRAGSDNWKKNLQRMKKKFQSTLPVRGATESSIQK